MEKSDLTQASHFFFIPKRPSVENSPFHFTNQICSNNLSTSFQVQMDQGRTYKLIYVTTCREELDPTGILCKEQKRKTAPSPINHIT